jgi:hypothetical protein
VDEHTPCSQAHLFTVRLWREDLGGDRWEWRGKVQHVLSGEAFYFREWQDLATRLKAWPQGDMTTIEDESPVEEAR